MLNLLEKIEINRIKNGSVLIFAILLLATMLLLSSYFISFSLTGSRMSQSQIYAAKSYYLAETGIQEAIFKLKNDDSWKNAFETLTTVDDPTCSSWSISPYKRSPALFENGAYEIGIENLGCVKAEITSTSTITFSSGRIAQRVVKIKVFKAMGNPISDFSIFTGGSSENIYIKSTDPLNIYSGDLFSNNNINIKYSSKVNVDNKALANNQINVSSDSELNAITCSADVCDVGCATSTECPPAEVSMPPLDFNFYRQAAENSDCSFLRTDGKTNCLFKSKEFEKLMWQNYPGLSLPEEAVTYIRGDINIRAGQILTVNGVLVADRDIEIGKDNCWTSSEYPFLRCGSSRVIVNRPGLPEENKPAGILAKRKIKTGSWLGFGTRALDINGLIYAGDEVKISSVEAFIEIHGGIASRKFKSSSMWEGIDIYLDPDVITDTFGDPEYSSVITIDHWEEEY